MKEKDVFARHKKRRIAEIKKNRKKHRELVYPEIYKKKQKIPVYGAVKYADK